MNCKEAEMLMEKTLNHLATRDEEAALRGHVLDCSSCAGNWKDHEALRQRLSMFSGKSLNTDEDALAWTAIQRETMTTPLTKNTFPWGWVLGALTAAAVIGVLYLRQLSPNTSNHRKAGNHAAARKGPEKPKVKEVDLRLEYKDYLFTFYGDSKGTVEKEPPKEILLRTEKEAEGFWLKHMYYCDLPANGPVSKELPLFEKLDYETRMIVGIRVEHFQHNIRQTLSAAVLRDKDIVVTESRVYKKGPSVVMKDFAAPANGTYRYRMAAIDKAEGKLSFETAEAVEYFGLLMLGHGEMSQKIAKACPSINFCSEKDITAFHDEFAAIKTNKSNPVEFLKNCMDFERQSFVILPQFNHPKGGALFYSLVRLEKGEKGIVVHLNVRQGDPTEMGTDAALIIPKEYKMAEFRVADSHDVIPKSFEVDLTKSTVVELED